jgi:phosphosulfolactate synthase
MPRPDFLALPARSAKPRRAGITHVLDSGLPVSQTAALLEVGGAYIDVWKFGWGTAYIDPGLPDKLDLLARNRVLACPGGTLLEIAWAQGRTAEFLDWAAAAAFPCVEVSAGAVTMTRADKDRLIAVAAERFIVLAEAGSKDPAARAGPGEWVRTVERDLAAGATWVLGEGRESGTVGLYDASGAVRSDVVDALAAAGLVDSVVFEAPRKDQQAWFVRRFGSEVNLANVRPGEALGLETLRLGLRADTVGAATPAAPTVRAFGPPSRAGDGPVTP